MNDIKWRTNVGDFFDVAEATLEFKYGERTTHIIKVMLSEDSEFMRFKADFRIDSSMRIPQNSKSQPYVYYHSSKQLDTAYYSYEKYRHYLDDLIDYIETTMETLKSRVLNSDDIIMDFKSALKKRSKI